jgi:predicted HNH restriction endonuclease
MFARTEGGEKVFISKRRERDSTLRRQAIAIHGLDCMVCGFNFAAAYGAQGGGFIEVHHVAPLSDTGITHTDPRTDLAVVCANCHRMLHRKRGICLSLDELRRHQRQGQRAS